MKAIKNIKLVILLFSLSSFALSDSEDKIYYEFSTQTMPSLMEAINNIMSGKTLKHTENDLKEKTIAAYEKWHHIVQEIYNTPISEPTKELIKALSPAGFKLTINKGLLFSEKSHLASSDNNLIIDKIIQVTGTAASTNPDLSSFKEKLNTLLLCNNMDCTFIYDKITDEMPEEEQNTLIDEYTKCINRVKNPFELHRDFLCKFLLTLSTQRDL